MTSFMTAPPKSKDDKDCEWVHSKIDQQAAIKQFIIFKAILDAKFTNYRSSETMKSLLIKAGFPEENIEFSYDEAHVFPTVVARR